jgi:DNA polymerase III gamma/tau subunit
MSEGEELYKKYRPQNFGELVGQKEAVGILTEMGKAGKIPHFILFTGPSGCGKTTIARILRKKLKCSDGDFVEINAAEARGIETIRDIKSTMSLAPMGGKCRVWLMDEVHALTSDAQNALLKMLEDTPGHVYFMFCTTDPQKLKKTIITRATSIKCKEITRDELAELVVRVVEKEGLPPLTDDVVKRLSYVAEGSARKALVLLDSVIRIKDAAEQMAAIEANDIKGQAIQIARALLNKSTSWNQMTQILQSVDEDPESIRWLILSYCGAVLIKSDNARAALILSEFRDNWFDCKKAGLVLCCYNVIKG